jgi:hypothetical protein
MNGATVNKFKWFWHDQDVEQAQWLRAMAVKGLHLESVSWMRWTFRRGAPADIVYRVDFNHSVPDADRQLLKDAGWEHAAESFGWQYWRAAAASGAQLDAFSDAASRAANYKRLLALMSLCMVPIFLPVANLGTHYILSQISWPFRVLIGAPLAVIAIAIVRLLVRLWRVRHVA